MALAAARGRLIAVIGDEDTCTGFVLGGIGEMNKHRHPNFMIVDKSTSITEIEDCFRGFLKREDIAIILINQNIAEMIRHVIDSHLEPIPAVLEIPSKDAPYDASKDSILRRAKISNISTLTDKSCRYLRQLMLIYLISGDTQGMFSAEDLR